MFAMFCSMVVDFATAATPDGLVDTVESPPHAAAVERPTSKVTAEDAAVELSQTYLLRIASAAGDLCSAFIDACSSRSPSRQDFSATPHALTGEAYVTFWEDLHFEPDDEEGQPVIKVCSQEETSLTEYDLARASLAPASQNPFQEMCPSCRLYYAQLGRLCYAEQAYNDVRGAPFVVGTVVASWQPQPQSSFLLDGIPVQPKDPMLMGA